MSLKIEKLRNSFEIEDNGDSVSLKDIVYYFNRFLPLFPSSTCICWIAIWLSFTSRSPCGTPAPFLVIMIKSRGQFHPPRRTHRKGVAACLS